MILPFDREAFLKELKAFGKQENIPNISWEGVTVLRFFLTLKKPKKVLEIGSANGFSSIVIADTIEKWNGTLLTTDVSEPSVTSAKENFQKAQIQNIEIRFGDVRQILSPEDTAFDFIFIDGEKKQTHEFFTLSKALLAPNGMIIIDDVRKFPQKMAAFWDLFQKETAEWNSVEIPVDGDDAMLVMMKKERRLP